VSDAFQQFLETGNEKLISRFSLRELELVAKVADVYMRQPWYKEMEKRIEVIRAEKRYLKLWEFKWHLVIAVFFSWVIIWSVTHYKRIDWLEIFNKVPETFLKNNGIPIIETTDVNALSAVYDEFSKNIFILHEIAYDRQYIDGKMGAQMEDLSSSAYKQVEDKGLINNQALVLGLRRACDVFELMNNMIVQTRNANTERQKSLYGLIGVNYREVEKDLLSTNSLLKNFIEKKYHTSVNSPPRLDIVSNDAAAAS